MDGWDICYCREGACFAWSLSLVYLLIILPPVLTYTWHFHAAMFTQNSCDDLRVEDERLHLLTELTKQKFDKGTYGYS
jgi:hypothetical protein